MEQEAENKRMDHCNHQVLDDYLMIFKNKAADQFIVIENTRNKGGLILTIAAVPLFQILTNYKWDPANILTKHLIIFSIILFICVITIMLFNILNPIKYNQIDFNNCEYQEKIYKLDYIEYHQGMTSRYRHIVNANEQIIKSLHINYICKYWEILYEYNSTFGTNPNKT